MFLNSRDYKAEYNKLREEKLAEQAKKTEQKLDKIAKSKGTGSEVMLTGYVEEVNIKLCYFIIIIKFPGRLLV